MKIRGIEIEKDLLITLFSAVFLVLIVGMLLGAKFKEDIRYLFTTLEIMASDAQHHPLTTEWVHDETEFGLKMHQAHGAEGHLLMSAYFMDTRETSIRLISLADGKTVQTWTPDRYEIRRRTETAWQTPDRFQPQSPLLTDDGGLVFLDKPGPLVRIDACSDIVWIAEGRYHHSIELDLDGNLLVPNTEPHLDYPYTGIRNDGIARHSMDGKQLEVISVAQMLLDNDLEYTLNILLGYFGDSIHLNDIEIARVDGPFWAKGDLALSLRHLNMIVIYRPSTKEVVWHSIGPWMRQHDPDFNPDGTLSVFGNDTLDQKDGSKLLRYGHSNIYIVGAGETITKPYTKALKDYSVGTLTQGKTDILANGDAFVEETDVGRLVRIGKEGLVWAFNNTDGERAGILNWSRYYAPGTLPVSEFKTCDKT